MNRINSLALTVFLAAVFAYAIMQWFDDNHIKAQPINKKLTPEFIAQDLSSDIFGEDGKLVYHIKADAMEHYAEMALTHFVEPYYTLYPNNGEQPWKMSASKATLYDNNRVILTNKVRLLSTDQQSIIQEIHGKELELDLTKNIIRSEQAILVLGQGFTMYGSGLIVNLNTTEMTLTDHVQTTYNHTNH